MNIIFMGTPDFALKSLEALYNNGHNIIGVVTNVDKPKGRGMKLMPTPVKEFALAKNLKVFQPLKIKNNMEFLKEMQNLKPDLICVVAYGKILPKELLDIPKLGCINVHGSLLPKYRGAAPIQWAVLNGDKNTGITTMYMNEGMDTGDMILKKEIEIGEDETVGELWNRLSEIGADLLVQTVTHIQNGTVKRIPQNDDTYTLAPMINKEMAKINWSEKTSLEIKNLVRGLNPIMGAYSYLNDKKIKFWKVQIVTEQELCNMFPELDEYTYRLKSLEPGTIIFVGDKIGLYVKTVDSILSVLEIQAENSKKMDIFEFLRGNQINVGSIFE